MASWLQRLIGQKPAVESKPRPGIAFKSEPRMPTVKFDASSVTKPIQQAIRKHIDSLPEVGKRDRSRVYEAALQCVSAGGNLPILCEALGKVEGLHPNRAAALAGWIQRRAMAQITDQRQATTGITHAVWLHAGHCGTHEAAHQAVAGQRYEVGRGLLLERTWTLPGETEGCKCASRAVLPI